MEALPPSNSTVPASVLMALMSALSTARGDTTHSDAVYHLHVQGAGPPSLTHLRVAQLLPGQPPVGWWVSPDGQRPVRTSEPKLESRVRPRYQNINYDSGFSDRGGDANEWEGHSQDHGTPARPESEYYGGMYFSPRMLHVGDDGSISTTAVPVVRRSSRSHDISTKRDRGSVKFYSKRKKNASLRRRSGRASPLSALAALSRLGSGSWGEWEDQQAVPSVRRSVYFRPDSEVFRGQTRPSSEYIQTKPLYGDERQGRERYRAYVTPRVWQQGQDEEESPVSPYLLPPYREPPPRYDSQPRESPREPPTAVRSRYKPTREAEEPHRPARKPERHHESSGKPVKYSDPSRETKKSHPPKDRPGKRYIVVRPAERPRRPAASEPGYRQAPPERREPPPTRPSTPLRQPAPAELRRPRSHDATEPRYAAYPGTSETRYQTDPGTGCPPTKDDPDGDCIPGEAERDYPTLRRIPPTGFSCHGRPPGFYADVETRCQVWHYCTPQRVLQSFLCNAGTVFNQQHLVCDWWYSVECQQSDSYHYVNDRLYAKSEQQEHRPARRPEPPRRPSQAGVSPGRPSPEGGGYRVAAAPAQRHPVSGSYGRGRERGVADRPGRPESTENSSYNRLRPLPGPPVSEEQYRPVPIPDSHRVRRPEAAPASHESRGQPDPKYHQPPERRPSAETHRHVGPSTAHSDSHGPVTPRPSLATRDRPREEHAAHVRPSHRPDVSTRRPTYTSWPTTPRGPYQSPPTSAPPPQARPTAQRRPPQLSTTTRHPPYHSSTARRRPSRPPQPTTRRPSYYSSSTTPRPLYHSTPTTGHPKHYPGPTAQRRPYQITATSLEPYHPSTPTTRRPYPQPSSGLVPSTQSEAHQYRTSTRWPFKPRTYTASGHLIGTRRPTPAGRVTPPAPIHATTPKPEIRHMGTSAPNADASQTEGGSTRAAPASYRTTRPPPPHRSTPQSSTTRRPYSASTTRRPYSTASSVPYPFSSTITPEYHRTTPRRPITRIPSLRPFTPRPETHLHLSTPQPTTPTRTSHRHSITSSPRPYPSTPAPHHPVSPSARPYTPRPSHRPEPDHIRPSSHPTAKERPRRPLPADLRPPNPTTGSPAPHRVSSTRHPRPHQSAGELKQLLPLPHHLTLPVADPPERNAIESALEQQLPAGRVKHVGEDATAAEEHSSRTREHHARTRNEKYASRVRHRGREETRQRTRPTEEGTRHADHVENNHIKHRDPHRPSTAALRQSSFSSEQYYKSLSHSTQPPELPHENSIITHSDERPTFSKNLPLATESSSQAEPQDSPFRGRRPRLEHDLTPPHRPASPAPTPSTEVPEKYGVTRVEVPLISVVGKDGVRRRRVKVRRRLRKIRKRPKSTNAEPVDSSVEEKQKSFSEHVQQPVFSRSSEHLRASRERLAPHERREGAPEKHEEPRRQPAERRPFRDPSEESARSRQPKTPSASSASRSRHRESSAGSSDPSGRRRPGTTRAAGASAAPAGELTTAKPHFTFPPFHSIHSAPGEPVFGTRLGKRKRFSG